MSEQTQTLKLADREVELTPGDAGHLLFLGRAVPLHDGTNSIRLGFGFDESDPIVEQVLAKYAYKVVRFCADETNEHHREVIATGLTLEQAKAHCKDESTKGDDAEHGGQWFDGFEEETNDV